MLLFSRAVRRPLPLSPSPPPPQLTSLLLYPLSVIQFYIVNTIVLALIRRLLHTFLASAALVGRAWRFWLTIALLGLCLSAGFGLLTPRLWVSEGQMMLRPKFILEGYLLSTNQLGPYYAVRLQEPRRVERVLEALQPITKPELVEAWHQAGGIIHLRVEHQEPTSAEAIARWLLSDFRAELQAENRTREEADRLIVTLSPSSFAKSANRPLIFYILFGFLSGLAVGILWTLWHGWRQQQRIIESLDIEQLMSAPTLAAIPKQKAWWQRVG